MKNKFPCGYDDKSQLSRKDKFDWESYRVGLRFTINYPHDPFLFLYSLRTINRCSSAGAWALRRWMSDLVGGMP
jgi:hypothetical protein